MSDLINNLDIGNLANRTLFIYFAILVSIYISSVFIIFPLFIHFTKINREKDRESSIFQISSHLYRITVISQYLILTLAFALLFVFLIITDVLTTYKFRLMFWSIVMFMGIFIYAFNQIVVPIQNLLIFLLALQRFLLYFYPSYEKYIVPSEKRFKCFLKWLYFSFIFGNITYTIFLFKSYFWDNAQNYDPSWSMLNSAVYIIMDLLVIFSSIFYICILISVRKITRLASSVMKNRPEKAILYHTLVLLFVKLFCIPMVLLLLLFASIEDLSDKFNLIYFSLFFIDILTTPIVFQITYIFCNKTNLEALLKMNFKKLKTWMIVCCGASSNMIENHHEVYSTNKTSVVVQNT
ncbi:unnamed protein product [Caenorhabditis angaria]|uniref:G-protein coupled receptors family 1 profile domain-containing protein n=1 Tax=Caenorhabditis angaria TaxID=860376 RepID=A0A9P1ISK9_9PELO|nr:unnamed protein product [Caenorhabditis angaria]